MSLITSERRSGTPDDVRAGLLDPARFALLLDVDGTLIELASRPEEVHVPPSLKHTLSRLRDRLSGALCLVSGRPLADLDRLFAPLKVAIVGGHGAESRLTPQGEVTFAQAAPLNPDLKRRLLAIATDTPGLLAENKAYSLALHYRLAPELERSVLQQILAACSIFPSGSIEVLPGKAVFEVKPSAFNKGTAVRALMTHAPFEGRRPIFLGDDVTDESVFSVLGDFDGLGYSVGRRLAHTQDMFATPREVRTWLYQLLGTRDPIAKAS